MQRFIITFIFFLVLMPFAVSAQTTEEPTTPEMPSDVYARARVVDILEEGSEETYDGLVPFQKVEVVFEDGPEEGKHIIIEHGSLFTISEYQIVSIGDRVVVNKPGSTPRDDFYYIVDHYRTDRLIGIALFFLATVLFFGRKKGLTSMLGLALTIVIIFYGLVPAILKGYNPLTVGVIGSLLITFVSLYLSHGFTKRVTIAVASTTITLGFALVLDLIFVRLAHLSGSGTEDAFYLQTAAQNLDMRGLLLAGILLGVLGVLDDITTAQSAAIAELHDANPSLPFKELYKRGLSIGREHIASLVNTLVLAYVGVSFPLILLYTINSQLPLWLLLNSNFIAEEIVRTLVGSSALVVAVPVTTFLAAYFFSKQPPSTGTKSVV